MTEREVAARALELRAELDDSFGRPREPVRPAMTELLAIRVGEDPYAVRLAEVRALVADRPITRLPSPLPELLGLCAIRGAIAPVYDLAALLGRGADRSRSPRWLLLAQHRELVALAFDALDAQVLIPTAEIATPATGRSGGAVLVQGLLRPLISIATILEALEQRVRPLQELRRNG